MVLRKSFYIRWSAGRSPRVHEVNPGRDPSNMSLNFGRGPISGLTTHSPRMVNNSTMYPHPTQRNVIVHMKCNHAISCYVMLHATFINSG